MPAITMIFSLLSSGNRCISILLTARLQLGHGQHGQGEQVEEWIKILLPAQSFQADPVHLAQKHLKLSR